MENLIKRLHELFEYKDGNLYRKISVRGSTKGKKVGVINNSGYTTIVVDGKNMAMHRAVFIMHHGYSPAMIDHIDGNKSNNKIENLRPCTKSTNGWNRKIHKNNKTGIKNVLWKAEKNAWIVKLNVNKKRIHLGLYRDLELADLVAQEARDLYHGQFARHC
jgi:hypothetical protein